MAYQVQLSPPALDRLGALPDAIREVFRSRLERLGDEPRPVEATCMSVPQQVYRLRVADGVVVYRVYDAVAWIYVTRLRWR